MSEVPRPTAGARRYHRARARAPDPRPSRPADRGAARRPGPRPDRRCARRRAVRPARVNDEPRERHADAAPRGRRALWMWSIGTALSMRTSAPKAFCVTAAVSASRRRPTSFAPPTRPVHRGSLPEPYGRMHCQHTSGEATGRVQSRSRVHQDPLRGGQRVCFLRARDAPVFPRLLWRCTCQNSSCRTRAHSCRGRTSTLRPGPTRSAPSPAARQSPSLQGDGIPVQ